MRSRLKTRSGIFSPVFSERKILFLILECFITLKSGVQNETSEDMSFCSQNPVEVPTLRDEESHRTQKRILYLNIDKNFV